MAADQPTSAQVPQQEVGYRDIPGWPGYRVGSDGTVWSCLRICHGPRRIVEGEWRLKRPTPHCRDGRPMVFLSLNGKRKTFCVHTIVLLAFVGPKPAGMECCHADGNKSNNRLDNLRWDTPKSNRRDALVHGTQPSKLVAGQVVEIRRLAGEGLKPAELARRFGCTHQQIRRIVSGDCWGHILPPSD